MRFYCTVHISKNESIDSHLDHRNFLNRMFISLPKIPFYLKKQEDYTSYLAV